MKHYQCIKDFFAFKKGDTYPDIFGSPSHEGGADLILHDGRVYEITKSDLFDHFQELPALEYVDIDQTDHEAHEYVALQPVHGCLRFIAFGIAISATLGIFIYLALRWRS